MSALLQIEHLSVDFNGQSTVRDVTFNLDKGQTLALVGESGSGKSVTALSVLQLLPYPVADHPDGSIRFDGTEMIKADTATLQGIRGDRISMIFQEPMTSLNPLHSIEKQIDESLELHRGLTGKAARAHILELLDLVGIRQAEDRLKAYPHELSGGQRQRIMIAMALANEPDLLIADEPTTALDVTIQVQILDLLQEIQHKTGMALLLISHDLNIVKRMADHVCVMKQGRIVEQADTQTLFDNPEHPYTRELLEAEPTGIPPTVPEDAPVIMEGRDLKVWFPLKKGLFNRTYDYVKAVDHISLKIRQGDTLGVVGESGSGKSTLGQALLRLQASEGTLLHDGKDLRAYSEEEMRLLRRTLQIVFQDPFASLNPRFSIAQVIEEGLRVHEPELSPAQRDDRVVGALKEVGLDPESRHRYPHEFSGGQRQRIAIARAMILKPRFVVLDEPTSALDRSVQRQIVELLQDLQQRHNLAYLCISHDLKIIKAMSNKLMVMRNGQVVDSGAARDIFETPKTDYTRALISAAFLEA